MTQEAQGLAGGLAQVARQALARSNARIVVTGAGGWLGLATLDLLRDALGSSFDARVLAFGSAERVLKLRGGEIVQRPLAELGALPAQPTWVLHLAFLTKDRAAAMSDEAYRAACLDIRAQVLDTLDAIDARAVFVASSGAATRADDDSAARDMRLYGSLKRDDETAFAAWADRTGRRAVIARIFNITGPHINKLGAYAIASFILDALADRPIAVRAPRDVVRGYVAIRELMSLVLVLLGERADGTIQFDSGGTALELGEVAATVARALGGGPVERAAITEPVADRYAGDGVAYAGLLARHDIPAIPLDQQVVETARYLSTVGA